MAVLGHGGGGGGGGGGVVFPPSFCTFLGIWFGFGTWLGFGTWTGTLGGISPLHDGAGWGLMPPGGGSQKLPRAGLQTTVARMGTLPGSGAGAGAGDAALAVVGDVRGNGCGHCGLGRGLRHRMGTRCGVRSGRGTSVAGMRKIRGVTITFLLWSAACTQ